MAVDVSGTHVPTSLERTDNAVTGCSMHSLLYFLIPELPCTCSLKTQLIFAHLYVITIPPQLFLPPITHELEAMLYEFQVSLFLVSGYQGTHP